MTISDGPLGECPFDNMNGFRSSTGDQFMPNASRLPPTALCFLSRICAYPVTRAATRSTPGACCNLSTNDASMRLRPSPKPSLSGLVPRAYASVWALASAKTPSNVFITVSVRISVPAMNATPTTTARAVLTRRLFLEAISLTVSRNMTSAPQCLDAVENRVGGGLVDLPDDVAVGEEHGAIRVRRG